VSKLTGVGMDNKALLKNGGCGSARTSRFGRVGVTGLGGTYVMQLTLDKPISWGLAFSRTFQEVYTFGFLTIGILRFSGRVRLEPGRFGRWFVAHLGRRSSSPSCTSRWFPGC